MRYLNARNTAFGEDRKIYSTVDSTATAGQTVFNVAYDQGRVAVFLNGIRLVPVQDYTYTLSGIGSSITLGAGITANDYLELIGLQGINAGNAVTEDNFVVGTSSTGSGGGYTNSTTVFPVSSSSGDLVSVWRNGIKLVPTTDFTVASNASTVTLQAAANASDEITVHVVGILQHSNFVQTTGGTFTGTVAHTGDTTFGDNNKSIYGAGSDLQIYHDGSNSIIKDTGTGDLIIGGDNNVTIANSALTEVKALFTTDGASSLYYDNSSKIQTTNTGVNVTGGATITGHVGIGTSSPTTFSGYSTVHHKNASGDAINLTETDGGVISQEIVTDSSSGSVLIGARSNHPLRLTVNDSEKVRIDTSGRVGIGVDSPNTGTRVHIKNTDDTRGLYIENTLSSSYAEAHFKASREFRIGTGNSTSDVNARDRFYIYDATAAAHRFTLDSSGNVGIGTTNPTLGILQVEKTSSAGSASIAINAPGSGTHSEVYHITANRRFNVGVHGNTGKYFIYDNNGGATRLEIDNNGKVGIGGITGGEQLTLDGGSGVNSGYIGWKGGGSHIGFVGGGGGLGGGSATNLVVRAENVLDFNIGTTTYFRIEGDGTHKYKYLFNGTATGIGNSANTDYEITNFNWNSYGHIGEVILQLFWTSGNASLGYNHRLIAIIPSMSANTATIYHGNYQTVHADTSNYSSALSSVAHHTNAGSFHARVRWNSSGNYAALRPFFRTNAVPNSSGVTMYVLKRSLL